MKDKSWIIILIMGIALTISISYSIVVSQREKLGESTVTTTSIIEMTATTVTIKNTLTGNGAIEYKEKKQSTENSEGNNVDNTITNNELTENILEENQTLEDTPQEQNKIYQVTLSVEDKDINKLKIGQDVEILIKKDEESLIYIGKVININKNTNNKSTIDIEVLYPDENIKEQITATCKVIIQKAENVVALPVEAIQKNEEGKEYVDVVQFDGTTKSILIETGLSDDYYVEITSGLTVGDRVQIVKSSTTVVNPNVTSET